MQLGRKAGHVPFSTFDRLGKGAMDPVAEPSLANRFCAVLDVTQPAVSSARHTFRLAAKARREMKRRNQVHVKSGEPAGFGDELRFITGWAWILAGLGLICIPILYTVLVHDPNAPLLYASSSACCAQCSGGATSCCSVT